MSPSKTVVLGLAALFVSAVSAQAATPAKHTTHKPAHTMTHKTSAASADNSADSLNAQSLTRAQSPQ